MEFDPTSDANLQNPADKPCNVAVDTPPLTAGGGTIWARFDCRGLIDQNQPDLYCQAPTGFFFFDYCD